MLHWVCYAVVGAEKLKARKYRLSGSEQTLYHKRTAHSQRAQ
jgi:hypothetical protein